MLLTSCAKAVRDRTTTPSTGSSSSSRQQAGLCREEAPSRCCFCVPPLRSCSSCLQRLTVLAFALAIMASTAVGMGLDGSPGNTARYAVASKDATVTVHSRLAIMAKALLESGRRHTCTCRLVIALAHRELCACRPASSARTAVAALFDRAPPAVTRCEARGNLAHRAHQHSLADRVHRGHQGGAQGAVGARPCGGVPAGGTVTRHDSSLCCLSSARGDSRPLPAPPAARGLHHRHGARRRHLRQGGRARSGRAAAQGHTGAHVGEGRSTEVHADDQRTQGHSLHRGSIE